MSSSVLSMFFSKNFIVSGLAFRSLIHFEFIFQTKMSIFNDKRFSSQRRYTS